MMSNKVWTYYALSLLLVVSACTDTSEQSVHELLAKLPFKHLENYEYNLESELVERVSETPDMILSYLKEIDSVDH